MFRIFVLVLFSVIVVSEAKPGLIDWFTGSDCQPITDNSCAIVYDDEDCEEGDWTPLSIRADGRPVSFTTNPFKVSPAQLLKNRKYKDDIESLVVRKGCTLTVYKESDCTGRSYTFRASNMEDMIVDELEDSDAKDFDEKIECLKCSCN